jgi:murein DD-endopeptidase MepM/ murein hydrolase activator NlpD
MTMAARRLIAGLTGALMVVASALPAIAQTDEDAAEKAAEEIVAARERANQAAEDFFTAESRLLLLELDTELLQIELGEIADEVSDLRRAVEFVAVARFVTSGANGIPILTDLREPTEQLHGDVLANVVAESGATTLDDYDEARLRLRNKQGEIDKNEAQLERSKVALLQLQKDAEDEVVRLREIESSRLENEAVAAALAARQREEARQLAELERRQAEAIRVAAANTPGAPSRVSAASSGGNTTGNQGASGGEAGGRTGGGGPGTNPRAAGVGFVDAIICPVQGGSAYGDTWGAPRSGGRRHQGVDMLAPFGTPLQAVVSGTVTQRDNALGGITISLQGDNGNRYYYAHLIGYEGEPGRVEQAQVIGFVGDTGNATGTPHLHFEIRPQGGVPVNPYPSVRAAGC